MHMQLLSSQWSSDSEATASCSWTCRASLSKCMCLWPKKFDFVHLLARGWGPSEIFFWPSFSAISRSSHSTFMLCTALALLSASVYNITLDFVLILALLTGGTTHMNKDWWFCCLRKWTSADRKVKQLGHYWYNRCCCGVEHACVLKCPPAHITCRGCEEKQDLFLSTGELFRTEVLHYFNRFDVHGG